MKVELKPMVYKCEREYELLGEGDYKGYHWIIVSRGTHPTAYVEVLEDHYLYNRTVLEIISIADLECNGGITYAGRSNYANSLPTDRTGWWVGWDYHHAWDYRGDDRNYPDQRKWSTEEIYAEVRQVIDQFYTEKVDIIVANIRSLSKEDLLIWVKEHIKPCNLGFSCPKGTSNCTVENGCLEKKE